MHAPYDKPLPDGWQGGTPVIKKWNGDFVHLYRVTRPCKTCTAEITIDVTKNALDGFKKNAGLLLRNCPKCREARKAGGVGSRGGASRPTAPIMAVVESAGVERVEVVPAAVTAELETLRNANTCMKEELDSLYAYGKEMRAKLAAYELGPALEVAKTTLKAAIPVKGGFPQPEPPYKNNSQKMPWEG